MSILSGGTAHGGADSQNGQIAQDAPEVVDLDIDSPEAKLNEKVDSCLRMIP